MFIVYRDAERIVTQASFVENSHRVWQERVNVYYASDPPTWGVDPAMIGLSAVPSHYEPLEGARTVDNGIAGLRRTKELLGDQGVVGVFLTYSSVVGSEEGVYHFADHPEELVRIMAEETELTVIDPLEIPPMGDCNLAELKQAFGDRIVLKGNLHTTNTMLRGTVADVVAASRKAMEDAAAGGRFILSTGDQCGRDTPDENLAAMIETARTYGRY
jgi:hypothetical protein